jgi:hypothetical protein
VYGGPARLTPPRPPHRNRAPLDDGQLRIHAVSWQSPCQSRHPAMHPLSWPLPLTGRLLSLSVPCCSMPRGGPNHGLAQQGDITLVGAFDSPRRCS